jgi:YVTN family beta-propeller protein
LPTVVAFNPVGAYPSQLAVSPETGDVYVTNYGDDTVSVLSPSGTVLATIPVGIAPTGVAVSPDTGDVYVIGSGLTGSSPNELVVISDNSVTDTINFPATAGTGFELNGVAVSPTNGDIYVISQEDNGALDEAGKVTVFSSDNTLAETIDLNPTLSWEDPVSVAVSPTGPDAGDIYVLNEADALGIGANVSVIDPTTNSIDTIAYTPEAFPLVTSGPGIAVSPTDGDVFFTGSTDGIAVIDPGGTTIASSITAGDSGLSELAISPTGPYAGDIYAIDPEGASGSGVQVIDPTTDTLVANVDNGGTFETDYLPWGVAVAPADTPAAGDAYSDNYDDPGDVVVISK